MVRQKTAQSNEKNAQPRSILQNRADCAEPRRSGNTVHAGIIAEKAKPEGFQIFMNFSKLIIGMIDSSNAPNFTCSIVINNDLNLNVFVGNMRLSVSKYDHVIKDKVTHVSQVCNLMAFLKSFTYDFTENLVIENCITNLEDYLETCEKSEQYIALLFLIEQLKLLHTPKYGRRYSPELLIFSYLLFSVSSSAYSHLRDQHVLVLPSIKTLKSITKMTSSSNGLDDNEYLKLRISKLNEYEKNVLLAGDR